MKKLEKEETRQYTKDAVLNSKKFADYKDIFQVKLNSKKMYSMEELKNIIKQFAKKEW